MSLTNPVKMDCSVPGTCPALSSHGSSLAEMTKAGINQHAKITKRQNLTNQKLSGMSYKYIYVLSVQINAIRVYMIGFILIEWMFFH